MIKFFLFYLSKKDARETAKIFYEIEDYLRSNDNFLLAHQEYLKGLSKKYTLDFSQELISNIVTGLVQS